MMRIKGKKEEILACPHCGNDEYYVLAKVSGRSFYCYKIDPNNHEQCDNSQMHDGLNYREFKTAYCQDCQKKIGILEQSK